MPYGRVRTVLPRYYCGNNRGLTFRVHGGDDDRDASGEDERDFLSGTVRFIMDSWATR